MNLSRKWLNEFVRVEADRRAEFHDLYAFFKGVFDFFRTGRHFHTGTAVHNVY